MSQANLIEQIKELLKQWEAKADQLHKDKNLRALDFEECIDDLKGILPPEGEE
jgi:hypothetical protein